MAHRGPDRGKMPDAIREAGCRRRGGEEPFLSGDGRAMADPLPRAHPRGQMGGLRDEPARIEWASRLLLVTIPAPRVAAAGSMACAFAAANASQGCPGGMVWLGGSPKVSFEGSRKTRPLRAWQTAQPVSKVDISAFNDGGNQAGGLNFVGAANPVLQKGAVAVGQDR